VRRYRYRTPVLTGPWRQTSDEALRDAVNSRQAVMDSGGAKWVVPGEIEEQREKADRQARR